MMTRMGVLGRSVAVLALLGAALSACSGDEEAGGDASNHGGTGATGTGGTGTGGTGTGGTGTGGAPTPPELSAFCQQVHASQVGFLERCDGLSNDIARVFAPLDPCAAWGPAVAAGRMNFDSAADTGACITALQAMPCDADALPNACNSVLWGLRALGESCGFVSEATGFSECGPGNACVGELLGSAISCEGTCVKRSLLTQPCSGSQPCVSGETCTTSGTCSLKGTSGAACGLTSSPECAEGLHCSDLLSGGTCTAHLPVGATCAGQIGECAPPAICERGLALTGTCEIPPKPGDACVIDDFECGGGFSYCGADSTCHALAKFGEPCTNMDGEGTYCMVGTCDETLPTPVCRPAAAGEGCLVQADCVPGSVCRSAFVGGTFVTQCSPTCF